MWQAAMTTYLLSSISFASASGRHRIPANKSRRANSGERRHEYDHHRGYAAAHHLDVEPVCTLCHVKRDSMRAAQTHCIRGHAFDSDNTYVAANGTRHCKACSKASDARRAPRGSAYWAKVNANRRSNSNG